MNKLYCYAHLNCDVEPKNQEYQTMMATIMGVLEASSVQISFVDNEIIEAKDKVLEYLKDPKLENILTRLIHYYHMKHIFCPKNKKNY